MSLDDISAGGRFCVLAIDHRDSLRAFLSPEDPDAVPAALLTGLKTDLVRELGPTATGVMLEPEYSIPQVLDAGVLPAGVGFVAALEAQGYLGRLGEEPTRLLDGWSVEAAAGAGAAAAKLLLPYHPDHPLASAQQEVAGEVIAECRRVGIPLVLEPLYYDLDSPADRRRVVVETARRFATAGPELLKLPFPVDPSHEPDRSVWREACRELAAEVSMPWVLLSGGGSFELFHEQVEAALDAGAAGCMVGRALWGEAARAPRAERVSVIRKVVAPRFARLRHLILGP